MKKFLSVVLLVSLVSMILVGCGGKMETQNPDGPTTLIISNWGFSEDELLENIFKPFEEKFNAKIVLDTGNNSERLIKIRSNPNNNVDLIYLAQAFAQEGFDEGLFEKIDYSKIPNASQLNEKAKELTIEGQGPAYTVNRLGIIYDKEKLGFEIESFEDLWRPELQGKISIPEITTTFGPAVLYIASQKAGVDITTDNGEAAFKELEALKPNIVKTYSRSSDLVNMMGSGEIVAALAADFAYASVKNSSPEVVFIDPIEGSYLNFNTINIVKGSKQIDLAYEFINYLISEEVQVRAAKTIPDSPVNVNANLTDEEAEFLTYGEQITKSNLIDFKFVNEIMADWVNTWNRTLNQ